MFSNSHLLPGISVLVGKNQQTHNIFLYFLSSHSRSRVKSPVSFKKPCRVSMSDQYGAGVSILSGQGRNISSADELTASAQDLPERLLTQLKLEKMESRR